MRKEAEKPVAVILPAKDLFGVKLYGIDNQKLSFQKDGQRLLFDISDIGGVDSLSQFMLRIEYQRSSTPGEEKRFNEALPSHFMGIFPMKDYYLEVVPFKIGENVLGFKMTQDSRERQYSYHTIQDQNGNIYEFLIDVVFDRKGNIIWREGTVLGDDFKE